MQLKAKKNSWHSEMIFRVSHGRRCCARCGSTVNLELDHVFGRQWSMDHMSEGTRRRLYEQDEKRNLLRVLCSSCNRSDGGRKAQARIGTRTKPINCYCSKCRMKNLKRKRTKFTNGLVRRYLHGKNSEG
jgi:hypothetical protein